LKKGDNPHLDANKMKALFRKIRISDPEGLISVVLLQLRPLLAPGDAKDPHVPSPGAGLLRRDEKWRMKRKEKTLKERSLEKDPYKKISFHGKGKTQLE
jgi:hypothetical protein